MQALVPWPVHEHKNSDLQLLLLPSATNLALTLFNRLFSHLKESKNLEPITLFDFRLVRIENPVRFLILSISLNIACFKRAEYFDFSSFLLNSLMFCGRNNVAFSGEISSLAWLISLLASSFDNG